MVQIHSEKELLELFRPFDREEIHLANSLHFPIRFDDYLTWEEPSGSRIYLLFVDPSLRSPLGIVFRRDQSDGDASSMCEWCHSIRAGNGVSLLTATASTKKRVGIYLCRDLSCKDKLTSDPSPNDIPQFSIQEKRLENVLKRMSSFSKQSLF
jgi:hypothetical protein